MRENALTDIIKTLRTKSARTHRRSRNSPILELKKISPILDPLTGHCQSTGNGRSIAPWVFTLTNASGGDLAVDYLEYIDPFLNGCKRWIRPHTTGDICLKKMANLITQSIRETAFARSFGGEEFLILLPNMKRAAISVHKRSWLLPWQVYAFPTKHCYYRQYLAWPIIDKVDQKPRCLNPPRRSALLPKLKNSGRNNVLRWWLMADEKQILFVF